jgi:dihydroxyacetone kinase-like predicted kinase
MEDLTSKQLQKMILFSCEKVEREKEEINKINVFPVPDQDTGTNLSGTLNGVRDSINEKDFKNHKELGDAVLEGALMAAQGNTGIIYTGFMVGFFSEIDEKSKLDNKTLSIAFKNGYERAKDSIQDPKKGTVLDIMEAFADEFKKQSDSNTDLIECFSKSLNSASEALINTQNQMELLKKAGVVDAGGLGFLMILETYFDVMQENDNPFSQKKKVITTTLKQFVQILTNRYEVVALLHDINIDERGMREKLGHMGDCLDIIQLKDKAKIHIHTDDPYDVRDIIKEFGEVDSMRIEDMSREVIGEESVLKNKIGIVVDEVSGLSEKIINHYAIESIPYKIDWDGIDKLDGKEVCEKMKAVKSAQFKYKPKIHETDPIFFVEAFKRQLDRFEEVICITSSNKYFNSFKVAKKAKEELPTNKQAKIHIIDSKTISAGQAVLILKALDLIQEQYSADDIYEILNNNVDLIKTIGVINSIYIKSPKNSEWVQKNIEKDKVILNEISSEFIPIEAIKRDNCVDKIFARVKKYSKKGKFLAVIVHGENLKAAKELKNQLKTLDIQTSFINTPEPVISLKLGYKGIVVGIIPM